MELRCALLLATRPYAGNYMDSPFQGKFLSSYIRMIFVIFEYDTSGRDALQIGVYVEAMRARITNQGYAISLRHFDRK